MINFVRKNAFEVNIFFSHIRYGRKINKPGTARIGAISKLKIVKGDPLGFLKLQLVEKHEKIGGGPVGDFKIFLN